MENIKKVLLYIICFGTFGIVGIYLLFFSNNMKQFDSHVEAYRVEENGHYDSDDGTIYYPIYYYRVGDKKYECKSKVGSSSAPKDSQKTVYYDSSNPSNCKTEYEKTTNKTAGIICLVVEALIIGFYIYGKTHPNSKTEYHNDELMSDEKRREMEANAEKALVLIDKIQLIVKRVILGIIILVLFILLMIDTTIMKQTIKAKDYIDAEATYVDLKESGEVFDDYIYSFIDKKGERQEIVISVSRNSSVQDTIKIKYNENNPEDFYEEGSTFTKSGIIWYVVKIVLFVLAIIIFFNKRLLNKIGISFSRS